MAAMKMMKMTRKVPFRHPFVPAGCAVHLPKVTNNIPSFRRIHCSTRLGAISKVLRGHSIPSSASVRGGEEQRSQEGPLGVTTHHHLHLDMELLATALWLRLSNLESAGSALWTVCELTVSLSPSCSCFMTRREVVLILVPQPSLSLHPSQGVSLANNVTLRCHLPRMDAWVQLWHNGTLRFNKEKDKEQDAAEFSFAVTNLEDAGTYQCRYQVSEPLWTSNQSDPVELVLTGAKEWSHGNLVEAVLRDCAAVLVFSLGLCFVLDAHSLWTWRDESAGVTPEMPESVQFQGFPTNNENLTYTEMPAAIPCPQPPTSPTAPQSPVIYTTVSTDLPR